MKDLNVIKMTKNIQYYLITGLLSILPIIITYWIVHNIFLYFAKPGKLIVEYLFNNEAPKYFPEISGFILTILFIYFIGILVSNVLGNKIYIWLEKILSHVPVVNKLYTTIKQITVSISSSNRQAFKKVVFVEYPKTDLWTMSMVTGESNDLDGNEYYHIFIPTTPNPTSGYLIYVQKKNTLPANVTIEEAMKIIISGGLLAPKTNNIKRT